MAIDPLEEAVKAKPILGISITFLLFAWVATALRFWTRTRIVKNIGVDDWTILVSLGLYTGLCIQLIRLAIDEITINLVENSDAFTGIATLVITIFGLYIITTVLFKISLAIFFLRVVNQKWQRWIIYASVGIYSLFGTAWLFVALFQCGNPADYLTAENSGHCLPYPTVLGPLNYTHSILNAVTDWVFAIIPIFVVRSTQMTRQARLSVIAILCLGVIGSVCSVVRIAYVNLLNVGFGIELLIRAPNFAILSCVELGVGIVSICCATLRPLFQRYFGLSQTSYSSERSGRPTVVSAARRSKMDRSHAVGTEVDAEHAVELAEVKEKKPGAITVTTLIAHDVETPAELAMHSNSSRRELL